MSSPREPRPSPTRPSSPTPTAPPPYDRITPFLERNGADTERLFPDGASADPQIVADEITRIIALPAGNRPRRAIGDGSDWGAEIANGAAEELRLRLARRMHISGILGAQDTGH